MTPLLQWAIDAHGGLERWNAIETIVATGSITGAIWAVKGQPDYLTNIVMRIETRRQHMTTDFVAQDKRFVFQPDQVRLESPAGTVIKVRNDPVASFEGQLRETPWDPLHVAYFQGEALWTYFNTPFIYAEAGFKTEEIASIAVDGETWRRLKVRFPDRIKSHAKEQISCFGPDGLLRRHDYTVDILGGATGLNYAFEYRDVGGVKFFTQRRVYAYEGDFEPVPEPLLVKIDLSSVTIERRAP